MTYTYAVLDVSKATYEEIARKLREAEYDHAFNDDGEGHEVIDMYGIALRKARGGGLDPTPRIDPQESRILGGPV